MDDNYIQETDNIIFSPYTDIEDFLYEEYMAGRFESRDPVFPDNIKESSKSKSYYKQIIKNGEDKVTDNDIFEYIINKRNDSVSKFINDIDSFISS